MHTVYILYSEKLQKYYVRETSNFDQRFLDHNSGRTVFTKPGKPWKLIWKTELPNRTDGLKLEKKIKGRGAKRYLQGIGEL